MCRLIVGAYALKGAQRSFVLIYERGPSWADSSLLIRYNISWPGREYCVLGSPAGLLVLGDGLHRIVTSVWSALVELDSTIKDK